jgi:hypothetical protein
VVTIQGKPIVGWVYYWQTVGEGIVIWGMVAPLSLQSESAKLDGDFT